ncbi:MAG: hypothetical protein QOJ02_2895 [Acidobacteriota bacterium]|jgi:hypothetical protein|nr:hypothetical protein [Acidobacteriota bacterium]
MTVFAGIFKRNAESALPQSACDTLRRVVSRDPQQERIVFQDERCFFVKVDIGAYGEPGWRVDENGAVSILAGEPLLRLDEEGAWQSRAKDLDVLHGDWLKGSLEMLRRARGVFCAAHYQPEKGELSLIADKLCVRPLYYWADDKYVVFATALRIIESLDLVPKEMDVRGVTEMVGLGIPLGARTPYANVSLLRAAEAISFSEKSSSRTQYWRWDDIAPSLRPEAELVGEAYEQFTQAVARRIRRDKTTVAFLSGGLDSRCVVSALRSRDVRVHTFNFSPTGSQDQIFGAEFARAIGTVHSEAERKDEVGPNWTQMLANAWRNSKERARLPAERAALGWSGDGGSVGLGHVYVTQEIIGLMREGDTEAAIESYLRQEKAGLPVKFFKRNIAAALSETLHRGIREELDDIRAADPGRAFYLFLMLNDQRRHLFNHFENIDEHRLELQLPFYDSDFLSAIISVQIEMCLAHKFYAKFLARFAPVVTSVPWQAYPEHEPCPLPVPRGLDYQWSDDDRARRQAMQKRRLIEQVSDLLAAPDFPAKILRRNHLRLAAFLYRLGLRDYGYAITAAHTYHKFWSLCGGRYFLPSTQENDNSRPALSALSEASRQSELMVGVNMSGSNVEGQPGSQVN